MTVGQLLSFSPEELQTLAVPENLHELRRAAHDLEDLHAAAAHIPYAARAYAQAQASLQTIIEQAESCPCAETSAAQ